MRKFLIPAVVALSALAAASPAAAQYYPGQPYPGQGAPYGNAYGYHNNQGRGLEVRLQRIRNDIRQLDRRNVISNREARSLDNEARNLQLRVRQIAWNGINPREGIEVERRINRLQDRIRREANDRNGRAGAYGYNQPYGAYGYNGYSDRDRDGRNDRYEDDQGYRHD